MSTKINLSVFNGVWMLYHDSDITSQLVWRNGNYEMVFTNNIFGKYGRGWVVRSISTHQQYFAVKTNGSPWQSGGEIIYSSILEDMPENLNVSIVQFENIILVDGFDEHNIYEFTCVNNSYINIKLAYLNVGDNTSISHTASLPNGLTLENDSDGVYIRGNILNETDQQFNITFTYNNGIQTVSKSCVIRYHVLVPITFTSLEQNAEVSLLCNSNNDIYYLLNGVQNIYTSGTSIQLTDIGDYVSFYSKDNNSSSSSASENNVPFQFSTGNGGKLKVSGSVNSLYNYDDSEVYYNSLFKNCTKLIEALQLQLPSVNLSDYAYKSMFQGCSELSSIPVLSASSLSRHCYDSMFKDCTALSYLPVLSSISLNDYCYKSMFQGCVSLGNNSSSSSSNNEYNLPAAQLFSHCYDSMFKGCVSLTEIPELLYSSLAYSSCENMFYGCTALISVVLPSTSLVESCYAHMFENCINLRSLNISFNSWENNSSSSSSEEALFTQDWLKNVYAQGQIIKSALLEQKFGDSYIPESWSIYGNSNYLKFTSQIDGSSISLNKYTENIYYNKHDNNGWVKLSSNITLDENDFIQIWNKNNVLSKSSINYVNFNITGQINVSGNIQSLMNFKTDLTDYCYYKLFEGCTGLKNTPLLSSTSLADSCYRNMFKGCSSLTTMPELPSNSLEDNCYYGMFEDCALLSVVMPLTATSLKFRCYSDMFKGCQSLTITPLLQAINLNSYCCSGMFENCILLEQITNLPNIDLSDNDLSANNCYQRMFYGCTSLVDAPLLPAVNLFENCYAYMFYGCTNLVKAPDLPAVNLVNGCYDYMFYGCNKLNRIQVNFIDWNNGNSTVNWVYGVSQSGKFTKHESLDEIYDDSHIPYNWNIYNVESITNNILVTDFGNFDMVINTSLKINGLSNDEIIIE